MGEIQTTKSLKRVRVANADFENPDGSEVTLDRDFFGEKEQKRTGWARLRNCVREKTGLKYGVTYGVTEEDEDAYD